MNIEYIKYFYEVTKMKSISKVANAFHISQPALSQQIQRLEEILGHKLLLRSNKGVELTESGQIVEKYAKQLLKTYENMMEDLDTMDTNNVNIRIDSNNIIATYALPCTLYDVKEKFSNYNFNLSSKLTTEVEQNVLNDNCDIGFIYGEPEEKDLDYIKVGKDRLVLIAGNNLSIPPEMQLKDLIKYEFIMLQEKQRGFKKLYKYLSNEGYDINDFNIALQLDSTESIKSTVSKGYGLSWVPYISVKKELYTKQLKEITVTDLDMDLDIYLIFNKDKEYSKEIKMFIDYIKNIGEKSFC